MDKIVAQLNWPKKAVQTITLIEKEDGSLHMGLAILVPIKVASAEPIMKMFGVTVPINNEERAAAIRVLQGIADDNEGEGSKGQTAIAVEADSGNARNGRPGKPVTKSRKV